MMLPLLNWTRDKDFKSYLIKKKKLGKHFNFTFAKPPHICKPNATAEFPSANCRLVLGAAGTVLEEDSLSRVLQISDAPKFLIFQNLLLEQAALWF